MITNEIAYNLIIERGLHLVPDKEYADPKIIERGLHLVPDKEYADPKTKEIVVREDAAWQEYIKVRGELLEHLHHDPQVQKMQGIFDFWSSRRQ